MKVFFFVQFEYGWSNRRNKEQKAWEVSVYTWNEMKFILTYNNYDYNILV